jgi:hypothetical protein
MEADWEFEIAPDAPVIDAAWSGYLDLRAHPDSASHLPEVAGLPALAGVLTSLNAARSSVWTAKCDVWAPDAVDPHELEAVPETAAHALSCYIDMLPSGEAWPTIESAADWCRELCAKLRAETLRQCRADLVIRRAFLSPTQTGLGITAYVTGCGPTPSAAQGVLSLALALFARELTTAAS